MAGISNIIHRIRNLNNRMSCTVCAMEMNGALNHTVCLGKGTYPIVPNIRQP